ncbi:MAG: zinc-dependent metalloprotease [Flavisolibacter sp.]
MRKFLFVLLLVPIIVLGQKPGSSILDKVKGAKAFPGFFNFYWNDSAGKLYLEIDKLDSEILYQTSLPAGLGSNDIGLDRGLLGSTAIVKFTRAGNKILMVQPNYNFRAIGGMASEKRAVEQSFAASTLWGFPIEAEEKGRILVDATPFILRDAMQVSNRLTQLKQGNYTIDPTRSAMYLPGTKNFPLNSELEATVTFVTKDASPGGLVSSVAPSADAITLRIHHSFVQLPDHQYEPRIFDPRAGYFAISYFDYSTPVSEPIDKYFICRHRLQKKDPSAAVSEAVKPIVYYLDNGTPEPIRSALLEGASWWNQAFEAAGYKNAFQVKILPEDADPMDIRYNMINWVHRSTRGWSYGASVVDPRTGEIIKGQVTLGSLRVRQDYLIAQGLLAPFENGMPADDKMLKMALQRLKQLAAHEVGHTLGLMHNYIASTEDRASVMDYPSPEVHINARGELDLNEAYTNEIGAWDKVSIQYGYTDFPTGVDQAVALDQLLKDAARKGLSFISDRDARDPAGLHPTAHLWDVGKDPVTALDEVLKVRSKALEKFGENDIRKGVPMAMLEDVLVPIYLFHRYQLEAVTKQIGGEAYTYALKGDGQLVTKPVSREEQLRALREVVTCISPKTLALPERIIRLIPPRPAGYAYTKELFDRKTGLAFDPLSAAEAAADFPLSFLFNPARLNRMEQLNAQYSNLGIEEMVTILLDSTWNAPRRKGLEQMILQQNQQLLLTRLMSVYQSDEASFATKAAMINAIEKIRRQASAQLKAGKVDQGYLLMTLERIENRYKVKPYVSLPLPPGAPIGCDFQ